jgi:hypothetical protein
MRGGREQRSPTTPRLPLQGPEGRPARPTLAVGGRHASLPSVPAAVLGDVTHVAKRVGGSVGEGHPSVGSLSAAARVLVSDTVTADKWAPFVRLFVCYCYTRRSGITRITKGMLCIKFFYWNDSGLISNPKENPWGRC